MKRVKNAVAILVALVMLLSLAACKEAPECKIALEANSITELTAGAKLEEDVAAAIAAMIQNGDLNEEANTVLISVDSQDADTQKNILDLVNKAFESNSFTGAALCQYAADPAQGKAQLVKTLCDANEIFVEEELQALNINALKLVCETTTISGILSAGSASQTALVGEETAIDVAVHYAETSADAIADLTTKLDYSAGLLFYDVQFTLNGEAQEAYVDAVTGEILYSGVVGGESNIEEDDPVTEQDAIEAACAHVGAQVADIKDATCEYVELANPPYFDVTFTYQDKEQHIMVAAGTGMVLESDLPTDETLGDNVDVEIVAPEDPSVPAATEDESSSGAGITETEAEEIPATEEVPATEEATEEIESEEDILEG